MQTAHIENTMNYDYSISISENEALHLKRLGDNTVQVAFEDLLTGTTTKLAYYKSGTWRAFNAPNYERLFKLFRTHKHLRPKLHKFLSLCVEDYPIFGTEMQKVFVFAKKKVVVSVKSARREFSKMMSL